LEISFKDSMPLYSSLVFLSFMGTGKPGKQKLTVCDVMSPMLTDVPDAGLPCLLGIRKVRPFP
jgi:hypothetical protein